MSPTIAIAIPHAAHKPGRAASLERLRAQLGGDGSDRRVFADKEPHWRWSLRLWRWGLESGADWLVQLQDDVEVPATFRDAVKAALSVAPEHCEVVALFGIHPLARELARVGNRWHTTANWLMGNGYALSRPFLAEFVPWVEANEAIARVTCEDALINRFVTETGRRVFHTIPSLVEHDLTIPSTWGEQAASMGLDRPENHGHRKAVVSYRDYSAAEITRPDFWHQQGEVRALLDSLGPRCWMCLGAEKAFISSKESGVHIGKGCFTKMAEHAAGCAER
jgi:hypothetical protein